MLPELDSMVLTDTKILLQPAEGESKTSSGIILHSWSHQNHKKGLVVLTGPGALTEQNTRVKLGIQAGDTVFYKSEEGVEVSINGKKFLLFMNEQAIVGKV